MTTKDIFLQIMDTHLEIALATSAYSLPNVRIVNFYYDRVRNVLFFASFENQDKIREFDINPKVAFTTVPKSGREHVRGKGMVQKSALCVYDLAEAFIEKNPEFKEIIEEAGEHLDLFEIKLQTVVVCLEFGQNALLEL